PSPAGLLSRITGIDASGARGIEVWRAGDDAQAFAKQSAPLLAAVPMPPPSRVTGFQVTPYEVTWSPAARWWRPGRGQGTMGSAASRGSRGVPAAARAPATTVGCRRPGMTVGAWDTAHGVVSPKH